MSKSDLFQGLLAFTQARTFEMNPSLFTSLVWKMENAWKDYFAVGTYYVGCLPPELLKAVLVLRRYGNEHEIRTLAEKSRYQVRN